MSPWIPNAESRRVRRSWWIFALRGAVAVAFGFVALFCPVTLRSFMRLIAGYCLIEGALVLLEGARMGWGQYAVFGAISILVGAFFSSWPASELAGFLLVAGLWMGARGVLGIIVLTEFRRAFSGAQGVILGIAGMLSIAFGIVAMIWPVFSDWSTGFISVIYLISAYSIAYGALLFGMGAEACHGHELKTTEKTI